MRDSDNRFTETMKCGHCGNSAPMRVVATYRHQFIEEGPPPEFESGRDWELAVCPACDGIILRQVDWHEAFEPWEWQIQILFPFADRLPVGLPSAVDKAYQAAIRVRKIDSNAFAVLLGRVIDEVCIDRKASGDSMYDRLNSLAQKGEIPNRLAEMGQQLRQLRNIGAHADLGDLTPDEVPILDDLCRAVLEYVYTAPRLIERVSQRIEDLKKAH